MQYVSKFTQCFANCLNVPENSRRQATCVVGLVESVIFFMFMIMAAAYSVHPQELIELSSGTLSTKFETVIEHVAIVVAVICAVMVILSVLIIFGAQTRRPLLLLPWIGGYLVVLILYVFGVVAQIIGLFYIGVPIMALVTFTTSVLTLWIGVYMIFIVYYFYRDLRKLNF